MIRADAGMSISRFAELIEVPRRTYTRQRARWLAGEPPKGLWPAPTVERIEPTVAKLAAEFPAWGHRKIWALHNLDHPDQPVSQSSVRRAMARRDLLQPAGYQRERRELAKARRAAFVDPPTHRDDGIDLARHVEHQRQIFNTRRPHEALDWRFPRDVYLTTPPNFPHPETEPDS